MTAVVSRWPWFAAAVAYVLLAAALLTLYWWPEAKLLAGDERSFYQPTALAVLQGGDWFDRELIWPPLQGVFMAAIYALAGPHILAVQLVQLLLLAGAGLLLRQLWLGLTGNATAAAWAGALLAINPLTIAFATYLWPEGLHLFLSLLLAWLLLRMRAALPRPRSAVWLAVAAGAVLGLCLLTKNLLAAFWPLLLLVLIEPGRWRASGVRVLGFILAALLVTAPALYRGWQISGRPQIADSAWFNLWVGLGDRWRSDLVFPDTGERMREYLDSASAPSERAEFAKTQALAQVRREGVVAIAAAQLGKQYFRLFDARNFLVAQLPGAECRGYINHYRITDPWLIAVVDYGARTWHVALLVLAALGLAAWRDWRRAWLWLLAAFVAYQLALLLVLHVKSRFLLPMLPILCAFAGHRLALWQSGNAGTATSPLRHGLAIALAAVLVFLATAGPLLDNACAQATATQSAGP